MPNSYPYEPTVYPFPNQPWDLDVRDWGAKGDGTTDDTTAIQNALNAAESYGGGIVFFPPGTYLISATIQLPSKVYMKGVAGTTYNFIDLSRDNFLPRVNTVIKLKDTALSGIAMIEPKNPNDFSSAGIENLILDGNKACQTGSGYYGIKISDAPTPAYKDGNRSQAQFRNIIVYQVKGIGFYAGYNQHELFLDWVTAFDCSSDGFVLRGEDIKGTRIASGANGGVGLKLPGSGSSSILSGAGRFFDVDCWSNLIGMEISDTMGYVFFQLQLNLNKRGGLRIYSTTPQPPGFSPGDIRIYRGTFSQNSKELHNGYSDIKLEPNTSGYGPFDIALIGCQFHGSASSPKPKYAIEDTSSIARRCIITDGLFIKSNYATGVSNKPQAIRDCFDYDTGDLLTESELHYNWLAGNYNLGLGDGFVAIDAGAQARTVNLPLLSTMNVGRVFYVTKTDTTANVVTILATGTDKINGVQSVTLNGQYQTFMIIHAGTEWIGIKIA